MKGLLQDPTLGTYLFDPLDQILCPNECSDGSCDSVAEYNACQDCDQWGYANTQPADWSLTPISIPVSNSSPATVQFTFPSQFIDVTSNTPCDHNNLVFKGVTSHTSVAFTPTPGSIVVDVSNITPVEPPVVMQLQAQFSFLGDPTILLTGVGLSVHVYCPALQIDTTVMPASPQIIDAEPGLGLYHDVSIGNSGLTKPLYFSNMPPNCNILNHNLIDVSGSVIAFTSTSTIFFSPVSSVYPDLRFSKNVPGIFSVQLRPVYIPENNLLDTQFTVIMCGAQVYQTVGLNLKWFFGPLDGSIVTTLKSTLDSWVTATSFVNSDASCAPIVQIEVFTDIALTVPYIGTQISISATFDLTITHDAPLDQTFYLKYTGRGGASIGRPFHVHTCGLETQQLSELLTNITTRSWLRPLDSVQWDFDALNAMTVSNTSCPINRIELFSDQKFLTPLSIPQVTFIDWKTIRFNSFLPLLQTEIFVKTTTVGLVSSNFSLWLQICGFEEVTTAVPSFYFQKFSEKGKKMVYTSSMYLNGSISSSSTDCPIISYSICTDNSLTCTPPPTEYMTYDQVSGSFTFLLDKPVNHTLFLRADTGGKAYNTIPLNANIYSCAEVPVKIDPSVNSLLFPEYSASVGKVEGSPLFVDMSFSNRTAVPYIVPMPYRFTTNDTKNCPVLPSTLKIEKIVDRYTKQEVKNHVWSNQVRATRGNLEVIKSNYLIAGWNIFFSVSNSKIPSSSTMLATLNIFQYINRPPEFSRILGSFKIEVIDYEGYEDQNFTYKFPAILDEDRDWATVQIENKDKHRFNATVNHLTKSVDFSGFQKGDVGTHIIKFLVFDKEGASNTDRLFLIVRFIPPEKIQSTNLEIFFDSTEDDLASNNGSFIIEEQIEAKANEFFLEFNSFSQIGEVTLFFNQKTRPLDSFSRENKTIDEDYLNQNCSHFLNLTYLSFLENKTLNTTPVLVDWKFKEVTPWKMVLTLNFTNLLYVSFDEYDELIIRVVNSSFFVNLDGQMMNENSELDYITVPAQAVSEEQFRMIQSVGQGTAYGLLLSLIVPLLFKLFMSLNLDRLWIMYSMFQIQSCTLFVATMILPASGKYILTLIKTISFFSIFQNEPIQLFLKEYIFPYIVFMKEFVSDKDTGFLMFGVLSILLVFSVLLIKLGSKNKYIMMIQTSLMWNGILRSQIQTYVPTALNVILTIHQAMEHSEHHGVSHSEHGIGPGLFPKLIIIIVLPILVPVVVFYHRRKLNKKRVVSKWGTLFQNLRLSRRRALWLMPIFLFRRLILTFSSVIFGQLLFLHLSIYLYTTIGVVSFIILVKPITVPILSRLELLNEMINLGAFYQMLFFTKWCTDPLARVTSGIVFMWFLNLGFFLNLSFIMKEMADILLLWFIKKKKLRDRDRPKIKKEVDLVDLSKINPLMTPKFFNSSYQQFLDNRSKLNESQKIETPRFGHSERRVNQIDGILSLDSLLHQKDVQVWPNIKKLSKDPKRRMAQYANEMSLFNESQSTYQPKPAMKIQKNRLDYLDVPQARNDFPHVILEELQLSDHSHPISSPPFEVQPASASVKELSSIQKTIKNYYGNQNKQVPMGLRF